MYREKRKCLSRSLILSATNNLKISLAEIHKLPPQLLLEFRLELVDPKKPLIMRDWWFHKQEGGILMKIKDRKLQRTIS